MVSSSPFFKFIFDIFQSKGNIERYNECVSQINLKNNVTITDEKGKHTVFYRNNSNHNSFCAAIPDLEALNKPNANILKILTWIFIEIKRNTNKGVLVNNKIFISLNDLVKQGIYKQISSARRGCKDMLNIFMQIDFCGEIHTSNSIITQPNFAPLFSSKEIKNNICIIELNPSFNWELFGIFFMDIPEWIFKLPANQSFFLAFYIFFLKRQKSKEICEDGYFTISLRAIQATLQLPSEQKCSRPSREIKDVIVSAVEAINAATLPENTDFYIEVLNNNRNIFEWLQKGHLKVFVSGKYAEAATSMNNNTVHRIAAIKSKGQSPAK